MENLRAACSSIKYRYYPPLVNFLIDLSTYSAGRKIGKVPLKILVDNSTLGHAVTHETAWISTGVKKWGMQDIPTGYMARIPVHKPDTKTDVYENIKYLVSIAHLARKGKLELKTSAGLGMERFYQPIGRFSGYGLFDYNLFSGIKIDSIDGVGILSAGSLHFDSDPSRRQVQQRLKAIKDELYLSLIDKMGKTYDQDAWHICAAERSDVFCFLTMDFALIKRVQSLRKKEPFASLKTRIMTPKHLGCELGLLPISTALLSYHGASSIVRSDLHMPENRRRKLSDYKKAED